MKKLTIAILVISTLVGYSQKITSFVNPEAHWNVASTYPNPNPQNPDFVETTTKVYGFIGDTIIAGETWTKFYATPDSNFLSNFTYLGNLREENGVVFFMDTANQESTIYDFNLQVGDSVLYDFGFGTEYLQVEHIDSILLSDEYRKRFHFTQSVLFPPTYLNEIWIEGLGSVHGPLFPKYPATFSTEIPYTEDLTCYKLNGLIVWSHPSYDDCYINIVLSQKEINSVPVKIYPNPVKDFLIIETPHTETGNYRISIIDPMGKVVLINSHSEAGKIRISTNHLENGLYILQMDLKDEKFRFKFLKR